MWLYELRYQADSWDKARRVILVVKEREGDLLLDRFFLVTSLSWTTKTRREVLAHSHEGQAYSSEGRHLSVKGAKLLFPVEANGVFCELPPAVVDGLRARGWRFYTFIGAGGARFMCSWDTDEARVRQLAADIREVMSA